MPFCYTFSKGSCRRFHSHHTIENHRLKILEFPKELVEGNNPFQSYFTPEDKGARSRELPLLRSCYKSGIGLGRIFGSTISSQSSLLIES
ncbi:hypothetical protein SLA2020_270670 [Shorea laevis]